MPFNCLLFIFRCSNQRNEDRRGKLRDIELKVVRYQDDLEAGYQSRMSGMTVSEQVQQYREHLLRKVCFF